MNKANTFSMIFRTLSANQFTISEKEIKLSDFVEHRYHVKKKKVTDKDGRVTWEDEVYTLPYLQWAKSYRIVVSLFPDTDIKFETFEREGKLYDVMYYADSTAMVHCTTTIEGVSRSMWMAVTDYRNQSIKNPDSRAINDAKMRCKVKCLALFGLGIDLYDGSYETDSIIENTQPGKKVNKNNDLQVVTNNTDKDNSF